MSQNEDIVSRTLDALDRLMRMFAFERFLYLGCAIVSFMLLLTCLFLSFQDHARLSVPELSTVFGASGLIAASAARVSFFLNKSFDLVSSIIQQLVGLEKR